MDKLVAVVVFLSLAPARGKEPHCSSFHYEEQLLEKMIRSEIKLEDIVKTISALEQRVNDSLEKVKTVAEHLTTQEKKWADFETASLTQSPDKSTGKFFNRFHLNVS